MDVPKLLQALPATVLMALVEDLYGRHGDIDEIIEAYLESADEQGEVEAQGTTPLLPWLKRQVEQLTASDEFVDYRHAPQLSSQIERLLVDISNLAELDAAQALALLDQLLVSHGGILERVDDSGGYIGDVLCDAVSLWLTVAADLRSQQPLARNWAADVVAYHAANDYGCFDAIISGSRCLLSEDELRQLGLQFESELRGALNAATGEGHNRQRSYASLGLRSVAEALSDISLYELSTLLISPHPNTLQLERIIRYALDIGAMERAEYWLQQPQWREDERRYASLHNQLLKHQGNIDQLKQNLLADWQRAPSACKLEAYWNYANEAERQAVAAQVHAQAESLNDAAVAIEMLLFIDSVGPAAEHLIARHAALSGVWYGTLLGWIERFKAAGQTLAGIVCYRLLLTDLLERGYSKAYHHGARYFHVLLALDREQPDYRGLDSAQAFIASLQSRHWRKRSFWSAAGYPGKPDSRDGAPLVLPLPV